MRSEFEYHTASKWAYKCVLCLFSSTSNSPNIFYCFCAVLRREGHYVIPIVALSKRATYEQSTNTVARKGSKCVEKKLKWVKLFKLRRHEHAWLNVNTSAILSMQSSCAWDELTSVLDIKYLFLQRRILKFLSCTFVETACTGFSKCAFAIYNNWHTTLLLTVSLIHIWALKIQ